MRNFKRVQKPGNPRRRAATLRRLVYKSDEIPTNEYNFGPVPEHELDACFFYEYARESSSLIQSVLDMRINARSARGGLFAKYGGKSPFLQRQEVKTGSSEKSLPKLAKSDILSFKETSIGKAKVASVGELPPPVFKSRVPSEAEIEFKSKSWMLPALAPIEGFPESPWQSLAADQKAFLATYKETITRLLREFDPVLLFQVVSRIDQKSIGEWHERTREMPKGSMVKCGFFRINSSHGVKVIVKQFEEWIEELCDGPRPERQQAGRKGVRDWLNGLGAMRLRFCYRTFEQARRRMEDDAKTLGTQDGPCYGHRKSMNAAVKHIVSIFRAFVDVGGMESPLHYTEGWPECSPAPAEE